MVTSTEFEGARPVHIRSSLYMSVLLPVIALALVIGLFYTQIQNLLQLSQITQEHQENNYRASTLLRSLIDMETGTRGFFIAGNVTFLDPFWSGEERFRQLFPELRERLKADVDQTATMAEIVNLKAKWFASEKSILERYHTIPRDQLNREELGAKMMMDQMREQFLRIIDRETEFVDAHRAETTQNASRAIVWGSLIGILLGIILTISIRAQIQRIVRSYDDNSNLMERAQTALRETNENLEQIVRVRTQSLQATNDELEAFSYSVSHDLRAPLRGIDGFSQALVEDYQVALDDRGKKYLKFIREGVQRMGHLIDDLLNLAQLNRVDIRPEEVDIVQLAKTVMETFQRIDNEPQIKFKVTGDAPSMVWCDRGLMTAVLENLFGNSIKYSAECKTIQIEFGRLQTTPDRITFFVKDQGIGFDMQYSAKLFKAFQRLHSGGQYKGSGIGLATVKRIISRHGGEIWAESTQGQGATFYFTLASLKPLEFGQATVKERG